MRNRVALSDVRGQRTRLRGLVRMSVVLALVPAFLAAGAAVASAAPEEDVAAGLGSYGIFGPVGIAAVVVGLGGLVTGLLRHRRRVGTAGARQAPAPVVDQTAGDRAA